LPTDGCGRSPTKPWMAYRFGSPGPCLERRSPRKPNGLLPVFFKRRLPKSAVTWQDRNLSLGILEEDTMDRLDAMSTFLAVVEAGSLSAAARLAARSPSLSLICGSSCSTGQVASSSSPMPAAPIWLRASAFLRMLPKPSARRLESLPRQQAN
jgi:hypothetical protein